MSTEPNSYQNKVAVITGGASGIGLALAHECAKRGARLMLADWEGKALDKAQSAIKNTEVLVHRCDVSKPEQVEALAQKTWEHYGAVDLLFNNAGVSGGGAVAQTPLQDWRWILDINLMGAIYVLHYFLPAMIERGAQAHIVNTASIAGMISVPDMAPYNVSKHGVVTISESLNSELQNAKSPIKVSVLCPSFVKTQIHLAERNRDPQEAGCNPEELEARIQEAANVYDEFFKDAMTPETLARYVFESMDAGRFYIFSHPEGSRKVIRRRMQTILDDGSPFIQGAASFPIEDETK